MAVLCAPRTLYSASIRFLKGQGNLAATRLIYLTKGY